MKEFYTKNTIEARSWCRKCGKPTMHWITDGRKSACQDCFERLDEESKKLHEALRRRGPPAKQTSFNF